MFINEMQYIAYLFCLMASHNISEMTSVEAQARGIATVDETLMSRKLPLAMAQQHLTAFTSGFEHYQWTIKEATMHLVLAL